MKELHLFILWSNTLKQKDELLDTISNQFDIVSTIFINWTQDSFSENLSRFYGTKLPDRSAKELHIGKGEFLLVIVEDSTPVYENRETSKGIRCVNINMFDTKSLLRAKTGGGHKIHGTDSLCETNHDLTLLLGKNVNDFYSSEYMFKTEFKINKDIRGAKKWNDIDEIFYTLNHCCQYAILRNYENLPEELYVQDHNDIDLICESSIECAYLLNAKKVFDEPFRYHYVTKMKDRNVYFDLREIGDNYYCKKLEEKLLENKKFSEKGFFVLNKDDYFYTLLYHALIQKPFFSEEYQKRLIKMKKECINFGKDEFIQILNQWLKENGYFVYRPVDYSVYFNEDEVGKIDEECRIRDYGLEQRASYYEENYNVLKEEKEYLISEKNELKKQLNMILNSKGWKLLEKLRKAF